MKVMLFIYRFIYGASLIMLFVASLSRESQGSAGGTSEIILFWLFACALVFGIFASFAFQRIAGSLMWLGIILLCGLLTWFGFWSRSAPFVLHELHTFDPAKAVGEIRSHNVRAGSGHAALLIWLLSLPIVHSVHQKRTAARV
jgi:hypothetical protein